jgi:branched-chain amino acid transport system substrate-binding protein
MSRHALLVAAALLLAAQLPARAQDQAPAVVVNALELSGAGAIAGNNFNNGALLAFKEIDAAGGILGRKIDVVTLDIETKPELAKAALAKATELQAFAVMGPMWSGIVLDVMEEIRQAGRPTFVGAEAVSATAHGNPFVFRTSLSQSESMPKLARYLKDGMRVGKVALVWVDNPFGREGRDALAAALAAQGIEVVADLMTAPEQRDFTEVAAKAGALGANAVFVYLNERESADCLRAHVGLTADALVPGIRDYANRFLQEYKYDSDHNAMKGYTGVYVLKAAVEKAGSLDPKAVAQAMKGLTLSAEEHPGVLLDVRYDDKGDLDRVSFIVRVAGRHQEMIAILPAAAGSF